VTSPNDSFFTQPTYPRPFHLPSFRTYFPDPYKQHYPNAKTHLSSRIRASLPDGATLPIEPWNQFGAPDPILEESRLSSLDVPHPSECPPPPDRIRTNGNIIIYSGGFTDTSEDIVSSANPPVQPEVNYRIPNSFSRHAVAPKAPRSSSPGRPRGKGYSPATIT
jgi:hypothetical protein